MKLCKDTKKDLLELARINNIYLEGNILKVIETDDSDIEFKEYIKKSTDKDKANRRKRLVITKQIQTQNRELLEWKEENVRIGEELKNALDIAEIAKQNAINAKEVAEEDLEIIRKRTQYELINTVVKVSIWIIIGVGVVSTSLYIVAIILNKETNIIGPAWSNLASILLTNAFSIVGTIMGVKYANNNSKK
jgi:hypothetical protein